MYPDTCIAVCTYKRPKMLAECLASIEGQGARIIVVDNDPEPHELPDLPGHALLVREPRRGIACARNAALKAAEEEGYRWLAFIDDDGVAAPDWLKHLKRVQNATRAEAVSGPQLYRFPEGLPSWRKRTTWRPERFPEHHVRQIAATNNLLFDIEFVLRHGIEFNEAATAGGMGGEDTLFTWDLTQAGGRIVWTNRAIVTETVPLERTTMGWYARMASHKGIHSVTSARLIEVASFKASRFRKKSRKRILMGVIKIAASPFAMLTGRGLAAIASGIRNIQEARGIWAGLRGARSNHYAKTTGY